MNGGHFSLIHTFNWKIEHYLKFDSHVFDKFFARAPLSTNKNASTTPTPKIKHANTHSVTIELNAQATLPHKDCILLLHLLFHKK
jgi:hypothetical protein